MGMQGMPQEDTHENEELCLPLPRLAESSFSSPTVTITALTDEALHERTGTRIAFTNRLGGTSPAPYRALNLSSNVGDIAAAVDTNRQMLLEATGAELMIDNLIVPKQVHGSDVLVFDDVSSTRAAAEAGADGIVCTQQDIPVLLCFADCTPVISVAPNGAFSVVHAGWRGAYAGIPGIGLKTLCEQAKCNPSDCNTYIGPHIGACCYEVGEDLLAKFVDRFGPECAEKDSHLNLSAAVIVSLLRAGAVPERIIDSGVCTSCNVDRYYSYRAEGGTTGRHGALAFREEITWE